MKIKSFRITNYRNIVDSGEVDLEDDLTCFVGKNQSGKTALLKALGKFNPRDENERFNIEREWPRGDRHNRDPEATVCTVTFRLSAKEKKELCEFDERANRISAVEVSKDYENDFSVTFPGHGHVFPDHPIDLSFGNYPVDVPRPMM